MARAIEVDIVDRLASSAMSCGTGSSRSGRSVEQGAQLLGRHCTQGLGQGAWPLVLTQRRHPAYPQGDR